MPAPHGQTLALALLQVAPAHDGPSRVAREHPPARLHLIVEVSETNQTGDWAGDFHERLELPRVHVLAVARDVPPAREHEARAPEARSRALPGPSPSSTRGHPRGTSTTSTPSHPATARSITSRSSVAPGMTVMRPLNASSFATLAPGTRQPPRSPDPTRAEPCTGRACRTLRRCKLSSRPSPTVLEVLVGACSACSGRLLRRAWEHVPEYVSAGSHLSTRSWRAVRSRRRQSTRWGHEATGMLRPLTDAPAEGVIDV